jgi:FkbM family methyltransferase
MEHTTEDQSFREAHFTWKHRMIAAVSLRTNFTYTVRHGLAAGMKRRGGLGFLPFGGAETEEERFLRNLDLRGLTVYDIGAFEGILSLFFSRSAKQVIAYEPTPGTRQRLLTNLKLNNVSNVQVRDVGLGSAAADTTLVYDPLMPGAASGGKFVAKQIREHSQQAVEVPIRVVRLDDDIQERGLPAPGFIKIDVEGMELEVIRGAARTLQQHGPGLYIELHGALEADKLQNAHEVVSQLWLWGYRDILDVEQNQKLTPANTQRPSHIYCAKSPTGAG